MYICIDTETGGIDPSKVSLLTGHLEILDNDFNTIDKLSFALKSEVYNVTGVAMGINKIDLAYHNEHAESSELLTNRINGFLEYHSKKFVGLDKDGQPVHEVTPLVPIGHNVSFDLGFVKSHLPAVKWNKFVSYRVLDTQIVARFLQIVGFIPADNKCSLRALAEHFKIEDNAAHTADGDVEVTIKVMKALIDSVKITNKGFK